MLAAAGCYALAALPALAGSGNDLAVRQLQTLHRVNRVVVVDVEAWSDRDIWAKRALHSSTPLTPLQIAIASNRALVAAINATVRRFDLKSIYAARVEGYTVYLYMGEPPPN